MNVWRLRVCLLVLFLMGSGLELAHAGVFAKGGGESRTITRISPSLIHNVARETVYLTGHFSAKKGDRRVVISGARLLGATPVPITLWSKQRISVTLPRRLAAGYYKIGLEKYSAKDKRWAPISNTQTVAVAAGRVPINSEGTPHEAPISVGNASRSSICDGPPIQVQIIGGPFSRNGRPFPLRAELRALPRGPDRLTAPTFRVIDRNRLQLSIERCQMVYPNLELRLVYPDRSTSNWVSVADPKVSPGTDLRESTRPLTRQIQAQ